MKIKVGLLVTSIVALGVSAEAMAQAPPIEPPLACQAEPDRSSFNAGVASGRMLVQQTWAGVNKDCFQLERFASVLISNVKRLVAPAGSDSYVLCRHSGIVAGIYDEVNTTWSACEGLCCERGELIGEMAGVLYCSISLDLGGVGVADYLPRGPVTVCPFNIETCCDTTFIGYTRAYTDPRACLPYTEPPYVEAWDQARNNMCIASLPP